MWVANLEDVAPNGTATSLSGGALIGSMRTLDNTRSGLWPGASNAAGGAATVLPYYPFTQASEKPVTPGLVTRFDIEIRPVFATLKPGHSLRLVLGTGDLPHLMPNTTEGPLLLGGIYSVQHNAASLSWIDIPVGTNPAS
jgi:predicted acyl esterase